MKIIKKLSVCITAMVLVLACTAANAQADPEPIGYVQDIKGEALAISPTAVRMLEEKEELFQNDVLVTNKDSFLQAMLIDGTVLAMSENSRVELSEVVYDEDDESKASFLVKPTVGVLRLLSGKIVKQNPDKYKVETPLGTIGIRGTMAGCEVGPHDPGRYNLELEGLFSSLEKPHPTPRKRDKNQKKFQISDLLVAHFQGSAYTPMTFTGFTGKASTIKRGQALRVTKSGGIGKPGAITPQQRNLFKGSRFNQKAPTPKQLRSVFGGYSHNPGQNISGRCSGVGSGNERGPKNSNSNDEEEGEGQQGGP